MGEMRLNQDVVGVKRCWIYFGIIQIKYSDACVGIIDYSNIIVCELVGWVAYK